MLTLVIKGDRVAAEKSAQKHDVAFTFRDVLDHGTYSETIGFAPEEDRTKIVAWYQEDLGIESPYPLGSLLHYSTTQEKSNA